MKFLWAALAAMLLAGCAIVPAPYPYASPGVSVASTESYCFPGGCLPGRTVSPPWPARFHVGAPIRRPGVDAGRDAR